MNWKTLIQDIQAAGLSQTQIADAIGKSQGWVSAVSNGAFQDLKWGDGELLLKLHATNCANKSQHTA